MTNNEIDSKINLIISQCIDAQTYSNIMSDIFVSGIEQPLKLLNSLGILPFLSENEIKVNFNKNIKKILTQIKAIIKKPTHEMYKVLSCIYGAFLGDAMGAFCEFHKPNKNNSKMIFNSGMTVIGGVPGQVTDDSEMALSLAYAIMDNPEKKKLISDYIFFYYGAWSQTHPLDIGSTTKKSLKEFNFIKYNPNLSNFKDIEKILLEKNINSLSNGFLMRKSPFIAWLYYRFFDEVNNAIEKDKNDELFALYINIRTLSESDNKCTNPHQQANIVSAFYCLMALMAIKGLTSSQIIDIISKFCKFDYFNNLKKEDDEKIVSQKILRYIELFNSQQFDLWNSFADPNKKEEFIYHHMGYYFHALKLTLYFLCQFEILKKKSGIKKLYKDIMYKICDLGGDTDTNCCIVGTVIGPLIGISYFGSKLNSMLELIPPKRAIYSVSLAYLLVIYLKKSNEDDNLLKNDKYFLQQILTMIYGDIKID